jgi:hypothetical protein
VDHSTTLAAVLRHRFRPKTYSWVLQFEALRCLQESERFSDDSVGTSEAQLKPAEAAASRAELGFTDLQLLGQFGNRL